jgi:hypothetical protein
MIIPNLFVIIHEGGDLWLNSHGRATYLTESRAQVEIDQNITYVEAQLEKAKGYPPDLRVRTVDYFEARLASARKWRVQRMVAG